MAVIGARPATGIWFLDRPRPRTRPQPRTRPRRVRAGRRQRELTGISGPLVAILAAAGLALFYLTQSSHVAATGYRIDSLQALLDERIAEQQQLILEIGGARSPAEIDERARRDLRLVPLDEAAVRFAGTTPRGAKTFGATATGSTDSDY